MKYPKVSIIIVNFNQYQLTRNCLNSLIKIKYPSVEIVLVDNGSSDGSVSKLKSFKTKFKEIKFVYNKENLGFVGGNNAGYDVSTGEFVLLLNNDTTVEPDFLEPLVKRLLKDKKIGILQSKLKLMEKKSHLDNVATYLTVFGFLSYKGYLEKDEGQYDEYLPIFSAKGASMIIRKSILKLGLFDEDYFAYFEETDLCWRCWIMGYEVGFEPKSIVYHKMGATSSKMVSEFIQFHSFKNRIKSIIKNASLSTLLWMLPLHVFATFLFSVYMIVTGKYRVGFATVKAILWNLTRLGNTLELRKKVQKSRKVSDKEIFKKVMYNPPIGSYFKHLSLLKGGLK